MYLCSVHSTMGFVRGGERSHSFKSAKAAVYGICSYKSVKPVGYNL